MHYTYHEKSHNMYYGILWYDTISYHITSHAVFSCVCVCAWGAKTKEKSIQKRKQQLRTNRKSCFLKTTWVDLGSFWWPSGRHFCCFSIRFCSISRKTTFSKKPGVQERSGSETDVKMRPKCSPRRSKIHQKSTPKIYQILRRFLINFWTPKRPS